MLSLVFTLSASWAGFAQTEENDYSLNTFLPSGVFNPCNPDVMSMTKYGNVDVSLFTGAIVKSQEPPVNERHYSKNH